MISHGPGGFLGAMALLTDTPYRGSTCAVADTVLFELDGEELRRLAFTHPSLLRAFLPTIESVSGAVKGVERDREKLLAVGKLAAGLAHELNNPAAAARPGGRDAARVRAGATGRLRRVRGDRRSGRTARRAGDARRGGVRADGAEGAARPARRERPRAGAPGDARGARRSRTPSRSPPRSPRRGSGTSGSTAWPRGSATTASPPASASSGRAPARGSLLAELEEATDPHRRPRRRRRTYSYLDQAPRQTVDIHEGLESTLSLLGHKLRGSRSRSSATSTPSCRASRHRAPS